MKKELDEALCKKYPKIFRHRHTSVKYSCMGWGLEVGDGWYDIIDNACSLIQWHIDESRKTRARYLKRKRAIVKSTIDNLEPLIKYLSNGDDHTTWAIESASVIFCQIHEEKLACPQVTALQVKEKYGTLRFYINGGDDYTNGIIDFVERMSGKICDVCGDKAVMRNNHGWYSTRCEKHLGNDY
jgi:hypothetical protein